MKSQHRKFDILTRASSPVEIKSVSNGRIEGYGSVWGVLDSYNEIVEQGAFTVSLKAHQREGTLPLMLWQHDSAIPIGKWTAVSEDAHGLVVVGELNLKTQAGNEAYEHLAHGDVNGLSIGYREVTTAFDPKTGAVHLMELALREVSVVSFPSNRSSFVTAVKSISSRNEIFEILRQGGVAKAAAKRIAGAGWDAIEGVDENVQQQKLAELAAQIDAATAKIRSL